MSVIAHVDHGKSTLSDSLISKGGMLQKDRAGEQCAMDTLQAEIERGITIQSAGITLSYDVSSLVQAEAAAAADADAAAAEAKAEDVVVAAPAPAPELVSEVYVGNLPFDTAVSNDAAVGALFADRGFPVASAATRSRGFAIVTFTDAVDLHAVVAAFQDRPAELGGRLVSVQARGDTARIRLTALCQERKWGAPKFAPLTVPGVSVPAGQHALAVLVEDADGTVQCFQPTDVESVATVTATTLKAAREAAAALALDTILATSASASKSKDSHDGDMAKATPPSYTDADAKAAGGTDDGKSIMTLNLIDSPGHIDFNAEVSAALRVTDGALVVVCASEGFSAQTETVLRQALAEYVKPVLVINKVDRLISELNLKPVEVYDRVAPIIDEFNTFVAAYQPPVDVVGDWRVSFADGNVAMGSGYFSWMFSADTLAALRQRLKGVPAAKTLRRFKRDERTAVVDLGLKPIMSTIKAVKARDAAKINARLAAVGAKPVDVSEDVPAKTLMRRVMQAFVPAADTLVELIYRHLPSPGVAQAYRTPYLYGDVADPVSHSMMAADPHGPVVMYVSKIIRVPKSRGYYAFGRVFSGSVSVGQKLSVLREEVTTAVEEDAVVAGGAGAGAGTGTAAGAPPSSRRVVAKATPRSAACNITRVVRMMAGSTQDVRTASAGEIVALVGVDKFIHKCGTLSDHPLVRPIRQLALSVSPVVRLAVRAAKAAQTPRLVETLHALAKEDNCAEVFVDPDTGEHVLGGSGELQLEVMLNRITELTGIEVKTSDPMVAYRETVTKPSEGPYIMGSCLAKSSNKHIRLYFTAEPLHPELVTTMEAGRLGPNTPMLERSRMLVSEYGWDSSEARKVWALGPVDRASASMGRDAEMPTNILVDLSHGVDNLHLIKDHIVAAFHQVCAEGHLCKERLRGVRFAIRDAKVIPDPAHRGGNQVTPAAKRAMQAAAAAAGPALYEPLFQLAIHCPGAYIGAVFGCLSKRRATILADETPAGAFASDPAAVRHAISAVVPVADSFGLAGDLRGETSGRAFPQSTFSGWALVAGAADATAGMVATARKAVVVPEGDRAAGVVADLRQKKGLPLVVPSAADIGDRL